MASPHREHSQTPFPTEQQKVVIPVAGVCNAECGPFSTSSYYFRILRRAIKSAGADITRPVTPVKLGLSFGIRGDIDEVYDKFKQRVDTVLYSGQYGENPRPVFIAHSFGGLLALRYHAQRDTDGVLTAGTPHSQMPALPGDELLPKWVSDRSPYNRWRQQAARFSAETFDRLLQNGNTDSVTLLGSTKDKVVGPVASLPAVPGIKRILMGPEPEAPIAFRDVEYRQTEPITHNSWLSHPAATGFIINSVVEMVDPHIHDPTPDNVVFGRFPELQAAL